MREKEKEREKEREAKLNQNKSNQKKPKPKLEIDERSRNKSRRKHHLSTEDTMKLCTQDNLNNDNLWSNNTKLDPALSKQSRFTHV